MTVNVGTIGHVDHGKTALANEIRPRGKSRMGAIALALSVAHFYGAPPSLPAPKPAKRPTAADLNRIEAAEAKRQRRIERNKQRGDV
jgi:hypothetical protein